MSKVVVTIHQTFEADTEDVPFYRANPYEALWDAEFITADKTFRVDVDFEDGERWTHSTPEWLAHVELLARRGRSGVAA